MKTWNWILSIMLAFSLSLSFVSIIIIDAENNSLKQRLMAAETGLKSVKADLKKNTANDSTLNLRMNAFEENLQSIKDDFTGKIKATDKKIFSVEKDAWNRTSNLEQNKVSKEELRVLESMMILIESDLTADINIIREDFGKKIVVVENKIFVPAEIYKKIKKAVVRIENNDEFGAGFLIGSRNQIITSYHLIKSQSSIKVKIIPNDGGPYSVVSGTVKKVKPEWDLAIVESIIPLNAEPLMPADISKLKIGDNVLLVGHPAGMNNSASVGIISNIDQKLKKLQIKASQIAAPFYYGNSGGPVINQNGEVIAVMSRSMSDTFNFGFAVPINYVINFLAEK